MDINKLMSFYLETYPELSYVALATKILENHDIEMAHRTLRCKLSDLDRNGVWNKPNKLQDENGNDVLEWVNGTPINYTPWGEWVKQNPITPDQAFKVETIPSDNANIRVVKPKLIPYQGGDVDNILVIGDLHEPFCLDGYLEHCRKTQEKYNCGTVIFIGDVIDNHYSSYHESDPDGYGAGEELDRAIDKIKLWYDVFPVADVLIGNHDRIVHRKAFSNGVSKRWIRDYKEVLNTPNWNFKEEVVLHDISFNHGEGGTARTRVKNELQSQVQGHLHSQAYIEYSVGKNYKVFGMQVGCGINHRSYAMAYGKNYRKPVISCGVVLNKGKLPIIEPMEL